MTALRKFIPVLITELITSLNSTDQLFWLLYGHTRVVYFAVAQSLNWYVIKVKFELNMEQRLQFSRTEESANGTERNRIVEISSSNELRSDWSIGR